MVDRREFLKSSMAALGFLAMEYDWEDLYLSRHRNGERRRRAPLVSQGANLVNLDIRQTGLGGASCGPGPMDAYRFNPSQTVEWSVRLEPARKNVRKSQNTYLVEPEDLTVIFR